MGVTIRKYTGEDIPVMMDIWNAVVDEGEAFPQADMLSESGAKSFSVCSLTAAWRKMTENLSASIFCIRTTSGAVRILPMPPLR